MNIKKFIAAITALTMTAALASCGGNDETPNETGENSTTLAAETENESESSDTAASAEEETEAPVQEAAEAAASDFEYSLDSSLGGIVISKYTGDAERIIVPAEIDGSPVVKITALGKDLVSVELSEGVKIIDEFAFRGCYSLESITLPESVESIGFAAFKNCTSLKSFTMPDSVTEIGTNILSGCTALESVTLSEDLENLSESTFSGCEALKSVILPPALKTIGNEAFKGCISLTETVMPAGLESIGNEAFADCTSLTEMVIPDGLESIGDNAFYNTAIVDITLPVVNVDFGESIFKGCTSLKNVTFTANGDGEFRTGTAMFNGCTELESIEFPDVPLYIGQITFLGCTKLRSVTLPSTADITLSNSAFSGCSGLTEVNNSENIIQFHENAFENCSALTSLKLGDDASFKGTSKGDIEDFYNTSDVFAGCDQLTVTYKGVDYNSSSWDELDKALGLVQN